MKIVNINQEIMGGTPVFAGTRVPIQNFFDSIETGETVDEFLDGFPSAHRKQVLGLLEVTKQILFASTLMFDESFV